MEYINSGCKQRLSTEIPIPALCYDGRSAWPLWHAASVLSGWSYSLTTLCITCVRVFAGKRGALSRPAAPQPYPSNRRDGLLGYRFFIRFFNYLVRHMCLENVVINTVVLSMEISGSQYFYVWGLLYIILANLSQNPLFKFSLFQ